MQAIFVLFATLVVCAVAAPPPELQEKAMQLRSKCMQQVGASEDDLKEMEEKHEVESDIAKKMMVCIFTETKLMVGSKFSKEGALAMAQKVLPDDHPNREETVKKMESVASTCATEIGETDTTAEEMAKLIHDCMKKEAKALGFEPPAKN